jgi:hypothetical protein
VPVWTFVHVPCVPVSAHDLQVPVQAVPQHVPCSQNPVMHSVAAAQARPVGFLVQTPVTQTLGVTQSASTEHDVLHTPDPHAYVPHDDAVVDWQVPVPLQVRAGVNVDPVQLPATQIVPLAYSRQAPPPSQAPSVPQVVAPLSAH